MGGIIRQEVYRASIKEGLLMHRKLYRKQLLVTDFNVVNNCLSLILMS